MVYPEYKVTITRQETCNWLIEVWEHPTVADAEYGPWRRIAQKLAYNMEGHADTRTRLRVALRGLVA
jgi:hypothetical protein